METRGRDYSYNFTQSPPPPPVEVEIPPTSSSSSSFLSQYANLDKRISPSVLLIIVVLALVFFLSGLIHLLIRYFFRGTGRDPEESDTVTALQGQLQQLFNLHDSGVDQSYIDTLPIFFYKSIVGGNKDPFDCAVCLCEFEPEDRLRLLPKCSHAFHIECIDRWLLSHSTCPLCRGSLLMPEFPQTCAPIVLFLESGDSARSSREMIVPDNLGENSHVGFVAADEVSEKTVENNSQKEEVPNTPPVPQPVTPAPETKVVAVKLGKFRNLDKRGEGSTSNSSNIDDRRCFSMGSFEYVMDEKSLVQVAIKPPEKNAKGTKPNRRRLAMSECDCHSERESFRGFDETAIRHPPVAVKRDSYSFSSTWLRGKKLKKPAADTVFGGGGGEEEGGSISTVVVSNMKQEPSRLASEFDSESEFDMDVELGSLNNSNNNNGRVISSRREEMPSFARRTLLWVMGRNQKVVNHI